MKLGKTIGFFFIIICSVFFPVFMTSGSPALEAQEIIKYKTGNAQYEVRDRNPVTNYLYTEKAVTRNIEKNPSINNYGKGRCLAFIKIDIFLNNNVESYDDYINLHSSNWKLIETNEVSKIQKSYVFGYLRELPGGEESAPLFDRVAFENYKPSKNQKILITSYVVDCELLVNGTLKYNPNDIKEYQLYCIYDSTKNYFVREK